jgi:hypothetical protein
MRDAGLVYGWPEESCRNQSYRKLGAAVPCTGGWTRTRIQPQL